MNVEERLKKYFSELANDEEISYEDAVSITKYEWGKYSERGYEVFICDDIPKVEVIEKIDDMDIYNSDLEASEQARIDYKNGLTDLKLIDRNDIPNVYPLNAYGIVDTEVNRKFLNEYIKENLK